jgi:arsenate reductase-like glutaredoxin family protein
VDAKKQTVKGAQALRVLAGVDDLYAAKGTRVVHVDLRTGKPDRAALLSLLLGPTRHLRAPTIRTGRTLLVGYDEATYKQVLG